MHQPQAILFAIAMTPSPITRITATGVRIARRFVSKAVAPVWKGDAWASTSVDHNRQAEPTLQKAWAWRTRRITPDS
jgi:hypothetical protein